LLLLVMMVVLALQGMLLGMVSGTLQQNFAGHCIPAALLVAA